MEKTIADDIYTVAKRRIRAMSYAEIARQRVQLQIECRAGDRLAAVVLNWLDLQIERRWSDDDARPAPQ